VNYDLKELGSDEGEYWLKVPKSNSEELFKTLKTYSFRK